MLWTVPGTHTNSQWGSPKVPTVALQHNKLSASVHSVGRIESLINIAPSIYSIYHMFSLLP